MTEFKRLFVDTAPFVYYLDHSLQYFELARLFFTRCCERPTNLVTSVLTVEEYLVHPFRMGAFAQINLFYRFLQMTEFEVVKISESIADQAARLRARYPGYKAMDALQIATALIEGCDIFVTNDKQLRQTEEIRCVTLDEFVAEFS